MYGLAKAGNAPKIFLRTWRNGLPWVSVVFNALFSVLAYMGIKTGSGKVFTWLANMTAVAGLITWSGIGITYLRFYQGLKAQGIDRKTLPFHTRVQPYAAIYATCFSFLICLLSGWTVFLKGRWATDTFITNYLPLVMFPLFYIGSHYFWFKKPIVKPEEMDFVSNLKEIEADCYKDPPPRNKLEAFWRWIM